MYVNLSPLESIIAFLHALSWQQLFSAGLLVTVVILLLAFGRTGPPPASTTPAEDESGAAAQRQGGGAGIAARLPAEAPRAGDAGDFEDTAPAAAPAPARILVVDDSAVVRAKLTRLLKAEGYEVDAAIDGLDAIEKLQQKFYAVLITDLEMPNMNGAELIANVQGSLTTEDLPIIAITGHDEFMARVRDYQGLYGLYKKPWNDRELVRRVELVSSLRPAP